MNYYKFSSNITTFQNDNILQRVPPLDSPKGMVENYLVRNPLP